MTGVVCMRAVDIDESLDAVLLALLHHDIEHLHGVDGGLAVLAAKVGVDSEGRVVVAGEAVYGIGLAVHPRDDELGGYREADDVDAAVGYLGETVVCVGAPEVVRARLVAVEAEPVSACEPYLVAVHVVETAALGVEPVVVSVIDRVSCNSGRRQDCIEARSCA